MAIASASRGNANIGKFRTYSNDPRKHGRAWHDMVSGKNFAAISYDKFPTNY